MFTCPEMKYDPLKVSIQQYKTFRSYHHDCKLSTTTSNFFYFTRVVKFGLHSEMSLGGQ